MASLARIPVPDGAWEGQLALALDALLAVPPRDFYVYRNVVSYAIEHGRARRNFGASFARLDFTSAAEDAPVATAFLRVFNPRVASSAGAELKRTLGWLLLEFQLEQAYPLEVQSLAAWLRGIALKPGSHQLVRTIGDCDGILQLLRKMEWLTHRKSGSITGHQDFDALWRQSLGAICLGLVERVRPEDDQGDELAGPLWSSGVTLHDPLTGKTLDEPDDDPGYEDRAEAPGGSLTDVFARHTSREAAELYRRSSPDLLRHPNSVVPAPLMQHQWETLIRDAAHARSARDLGRLEVCFLHLLAIEAGLNNGEALRLVFDDYAHPGIPAVDLALGVLRRFEVRPPGAWEPKDATGAWAATGGDVLFALSSATVDCGRALQQLRRKAGVSGVLVVAKPKSRRPVTDASRTTRIDAFLRPAAYRQRLATALAEKLGQDGAQIAFGDAFGTNTAPTYYAAFEAIQILGATAEVASEFVPEPNRWHGRTDSVVHVLGSRARPRDQPFSLAWELKGYDATPRRGRPSLQNARERWMRQRDSLALHLALATGHRPTRALSRVSLHDFIPEHAFVVLADKCTDPAHLTRVASTGWRLIGSLSAFVADLGRIAAEPSLGPMHRLAARILRGEAALFDAPDADGNPEALDVRGLFRELRGTWGLRPNLHRHALCQYLIRAGVDPELRFLQMGWQVHDVHAVSDVGTRGAIELTAELADDIDQFLARVGWAGGQGLTRELQIAGAGLKDWSEVRAAHVDGALQHQQRLHGALKQARQSVRPRVLDQLAVQIDKVLAQLELRREPRLALRHRTASSEGHPVTIQTDQLGAILEVFESALDQHVARVELRRLLTVAIRAGICQAPLPAVRTMLRRRDASPFLRGCGLASAQARLFRARIQEAVETSVSSTDPATTLRMANLAVWAVAAFTPYRSSKAAREVVLGVSGAMSGAKAPTVLRVPTPDGHAVVSGLPALVLQRLQERDDVGAALDVLAEASAAAMGELVLELLPQRLGLTAAEACMCMESTLMAAGDVELAGPERIVMRDAAAIATVSATRASACMDDRLVDGEPAEIAEEEADAVVSRVVGDSARHGSVRDLLAYFNPAYQGDIAGQPARPAKARAAQLRPLVAQRLEAMGSAPTCDLITLDYVQRLLVDGGPRSRGGMAVSTIYKIYHRLRPATAAIDADADLTMLGPDVLTGAILASFRRARRREHRDVLDDVRQFFRFAVEHYGVQEPDWGMLSTLTGSRVVPTDPAVVGDREVAACLAELADALVTPEFSELDPAERRFRELQLAVALLLEASGARPGSIHGLTLADIHLSANGDCIHLHATGPFGSIKTATSAGFVSLEGPHWARHFSWFAAWFGALCGDLAPEALALIPLFQIPGEPVGMRYRQAEIVDPVGELIRWSTAQPAGRAYWMRKRRVGLRFQQAAVGPSARARDVVRAMRSCGHASVRTPLGAYLGDPLFYMRRASSLPPAGGPSRWAALAGVSTATVDARWLQRRTRATGPFGAQEKLETLMQRPRGQVPDASRGKPPVRRAYRRRFSWGAIERVMVAIANGDVDSTIAAACWVSVPKVATIRRRVEAFARRTGLRIGAGAGALRPPRPTRFSQALRQLVDGEDPRLLLVAREWVTARRIKADLPACPVYDDHAVHALTQVIAATGRRTRWQSVDGNVPACTVVDAGGRPVYGALQALEWSLAVAWIAASPTEKPECP